MNDVRSFLDKNAAGGFPTFGFNNIGDTLLGEIVSPPKVADTRFGECLVIDVRPDSASDPVTVFIGEGAQARAVARAVQAAGATELEQGGRIRITFTETTPSKTPGFSPAKLYDAEYWPPQARVTPESIFGAARSA